MNPDEATLTQDEKLDRIIVQNERILGILEPLSAFVENDLPELRDKVGPMIEALSDSPVLKMLGVKVPRL